MPCLWLPRADPESARPFFEALRERGNSAPEQGASPEEQVRAILEAVRRDGLEAVLDYTRRFDAPDFRPEQFAVSGQELARAAEALPSEDRAALETAAANIRAFHSAQKEKSWFLTRRDGSVFGQMVLPVERAGLYVPGGQGGSTPLLSSLLMNAIPAQEAGVAEIALVSPPGRDGRLSGHILAAAHLLGLREVYAAGGAWAVAALAHGAGSLRPVDVIAGPGNIFVATAKRLLLGRVGIDMFAGPSEICVLADQGADPAWVAADMLSQAEHDVLAASVCLCLEEKTGLAVLKELERQCALLPRQAVARESLRRFGAVLRVKGPEQALELANAMAPEHLELMAANPWELLPGVRHAGAVFLGYHAPEPLGDYVAGPNHVLPTMGTARFSSGLSVAVFCKKTSVLAPSQVFARENAETAALLARLEGLEGHARSALLRRKP
ncbi:MAG: histidinol dehydrogenase [Deltaproteobacteria bacterium]|jgi:histidinol dehydrogenase|nr:histidinol dehydrogenase [Deltaproteobacteria bacterium]